MQATPFNDALAYSAPKHHGCAPFRLQGLTFTTVADFWVGLSHFLPGGGAEADASSFEKVYVVTAGEITVESGGSSVVLKVNDSCVIPANEVRTVRNLSRLPASMVVIISTHSEAE